MISEARFVGDREHRFEPAEAALGAPVLGQLDGGARQIAAVLLELLLEQFEQRERVRGRAGEAGQHLALAEPAHLARIRLHDRVAERDLAVAADHDAFAAADGDDGGGVECVGHRVVALQWI